MKVLFLLTYYRPYWTGLTQYAARVAEGLTRRNHQVKVLCSQHDPSLPKKEKIQGVSVRRLPFLFRISRGVIMPQYPLALIEEMRKTDVVIAYLPLPEIILVVLMARFFKKSLFLVHNGDLVLPKDGGIFNRFLEGIYYFTGKIAIKYSKKIVVHTEDYANGSKLLSSFKNKWVVIRPPVELPKVSLSDVEAFRKKFHLDKGKILIGFSGRFTEEKGVDFLLEAIPLVVDKLPKAHFVLAGETKIKYEKYWQKISPKIEMNKNHLTLLGLLDDKKEVFVFDKTIDLFVQPSRTDCFPLGQIEALLSGVPSVCTNIPGARWAVAQTGMGLLVEPGNPKALAEGIIAGVKNRKKYAKNLAKVEKIFDPEETIQKFENLLTGAK